jgi:DeoR family glycerol-3-phosphate regulon repressor
MQTETNVKCKWIRAFLAYSRQIETKPLDLAACGARIGALCLRSSRKRPKPFSRRRAAMDVLTPRQADIVALAKLEGRLNVESLADRFNVTQQTIRKDLNDLCERGILQRFHGGAVLASGTANFGYEARRKLATEEKRRIGVSAAALIPDNSSLLINIGTTTEQVAMALRGKQGLLAITNNIHVINILQGYEQIEVIAVGGVVRHSDGGIVGEAAVDFIRQFKVDYAVIGTSAIDEDGTLLDFDYREVRVAKAIME